MAQDPYTDGSGSPPPRLNDGLLFRDLGSYGLRQFSGWLREEFLPQLQGRQAARVYREMRDNSATVGSILFAITQAIRQVEWRVEPANDSPEAAEAAEFADSLRGDMSHTWEDFIPEVLSMLPFGYSIHEIVYKRRLGRRPERRARDGTDRTPSSKFDDGRIGVRRLPIRGQETVLKWFFDPNGQVRGVTQQPWVGALIDLPIEKLLLFRPTAHKGNPEGISVLRNAYRSYYFVKSLEEQEAILFERMAGFPICYVPNAVLSAANGTAGGTPPNPEAVAALEAYKRLVTNVRINEQMGALLPSDTYRDASGNPSNVRMYEFQFLTPQHGRGGVEAGTVIARHKLDMMMTVLADFLQLGHEVRGTNNLAMTKTDMFYAAIEGWLNAIAAVLNRYLLRRVWAVNGMDEDLLPQYVPDMARRLDLDGLGTFVGNLASAGMQLFPDEELESFMRDAAGLPDATRGGGTEVLKRMLLAKFAKRLKAMRGAGAC